MKRILVVLVAMMFLFSSMPGFAVANNSKIIAKTNTITGEITMVNPGVPYNKEMLAAKTSDTTYILTGKTTNLNSYKGYTAKFTGTITKGPQGILVFNVQSYKIISKASPTPTKTAPPTPATSGTKYETLQGYLYNLNSDMHKFFLKTEKGVYELIGNTEKMEYAVGNWVEVNGHYVATLVATEYPLFSVVSYKVAATPSSVVSATSKPLPTATPGTKYETLKGYLYNLNSDMHKFFLKTEKGVYELIGNTEKMENAVGNRVEVSGHYVATLVATEYPLFSVVSFRIIENPTPTAIVKPTPKNVKITIADNGGYAYLNKGDTLTLSLDSNATTGYSWNYVEKPDEKILVETSCNYIPDSAPKGMVGVGGKEVRTYKAVGDGVAKIDLMYSRPWESVAPSRTFVIKVIVGQSTPTPTPTPDYKVLTGTLIVNKTNPLSFSLQTAGMLYSLSGNTAGMEKYANMELEVTGKDSMLTIYPPIFIVDTYRPIIAPTAIPTPALQYLQGTLIVNETYPLSFELKTPECPYTLQGNTAGIEKYANMQVEVYGNVSVSLFKIYPPIFNVVSYKVMSEPTPTASSKVHTIISKNPHHFSEPSIGYVEATESLSGTTTVSWSEGTDKAFFNSKITVLSKDIKINYQVELVEAVSSNSDSITGIFNIIKDGTVIANGVKGEVYGLSTNVGNYFKFYSQDAQFLIAANVTERFDF